MLTRSVMCQTRVVGRGVDVDPDHRRHGADEQDRRRPGLGAQEIAQRRLQVARPRGPAREGTGPDLGLDGLALARFDGEVSGTH